MKKAKSVTHGWSPVGHWYVRVTGANGTYGEYIVCESEDQARWIAETLQESDRLADEPKETK